MNDIFNTTTEYVLQKTTSFLARTSESLTAPGASDYLSELKIAASILSIFFITIILYSLVRVYEIRRDEKRELHISDKA
ncbi:MAG: hypothetical protein AAB858_03170 [Patescibacteria group bacterium]